MHITKLFYFYFSSFVFNIFFFLLNRFWVLFWNFKISKDSESKLILEFQNVAFHFVRIQCKSPVSTTQHLWQDLKPIWRSWVFFWSAPAVFTKSCSRIRIRLSSPAAIVPLNFHSSYASKGILKSKNCECKNVTN